MVQKLQRRFIMVTGIAVIIVMVCFLLPVNLFNYIRVGNQLSRTLQYIIEAKGDFTYEQQESESGKIWNEFVDSFLGQDTITITPESRYQLRYFLITFDDQGEVADASLSHIAAVDAENAQLLAQTAYDSDRSGGFVRADSADYYFLKVEDEEGMTVVGFLNCTREMENLKIFYYTSTGFALLILVILLILIAVLSKKAMKPYIENIESQREFITNAGHELKTPFAIISANTEVIEMLNGKSEWTDSIMAQVKRGTGLINELITLSRTAENAEVILTEVDISSVTKESAEAFRTVIVQQGKQLSCSIEESLTVKSDEKMLSELVNILIDNAAKYCDDGGTVSVELKKRVRGGVLLTVANDYRDGSEEECSRYFRRFYRGDTSHNSARSGHGIGLSMAQTIAEKLKGRIDAHWKKGVITFTVTL